MRKKLLIIACVFCALTASAQRASSSSSSFFSTEKVDGGVTFGIRAGVNMANISGSDSDGSSYSFGNRTSFHIGVTADIPIMQSLYVQTGLFFQNKGYKFEETDNYSDYYDDYYNKTTETAKPMYLEIPVLASYRYNVSDAIQLQINLGPYFGYGIGGKMKEETSLYGEKESKEYDYFGDADETCGFKRFNCGLQVGAGLTFSDHYYLGFNYQFGLSNINDSDDFDSIKDRNWMISLGYNF